MELILLFVIAILAFVYFLRKRLVVTLGFIVHVVFVLSLVTSIVGVFFQAPFTYLANNVLENNGTLAIMRKIDGTITLDSIKDAGNSFLDSIGNFFGNDTNKDVESMPQKDKGLLEQEVYPGLVNSLASVYRGIAVVVSIALMAISIYLSFTTTGSSEIEELKNRVRVLEQQLAG
jgi:energy-coupling factor transporter transmembrane protein EcfT